MAVVESMKLALDRLSDAVLEAKVLADTFGNLRPENATGYPDPHAWTFVVDRIVERIAGAADEVETLVRQRALPVLVDMESVTKRGLGQEPQRVAR